MFVTRASAVSMNPENWESHPVESSKATSSPKMRESLNPVFTGKSIL